MCKLCDEGKPQNHWNPRRGFLKAAAASSAAVGLAALSGCNAEANGTTSETPPQFSGEPGRRYVIRGGSVMSMDPTVGDFAQADVLVEGKKIVAVGPNLAIGDAAVIDARGRIVMPGFIDTHHHQFETALRSFLADGLLIDGLDAAHHAELLPEHSARASPRCTGRRTSTSTSCSARLRSSTPASPARARRLADPPLARALRRRIQALLDTGRRAVFGYFESAGGVPGNQYPNDATPHQDAVVLLERPAGDDDHGRRDLPAGLRDGLGHRPRARPQIAAHIVGPFGMRPTFDALAAANAFTDEQPVHPHDRHVRHGLAEGQGRRRRVSLAVPIEMNMRHGMPPILKVQQLGIEPSLSSDVECTLTADFFTQMRSAMTLQRMFVNPTR